MEASFIGFQLWVQAVSAAGTTEPAAVRSALAGRSIRAPSCVDVRFDAETQHLHKPAIIGRFGDKNGHRASMDQRRTAGAGAVESLAQARGSGLKSEAFRFASAWVQPP